MRLLGVSTGYAAIYTGHFDQMFRQQGAFASYHNHGNCVTKIIFTDH